MIFGSKVTVFGDFNDYIPNFICSDRLEFRVSRNIRYIVEECRSVAHLLCFRHTTMRRTPHLAANAPTHPMSRLLCKLLDEL